MRFDLLTPERKLAVRAERVGDECAVNIDGTDFNVKIEKTNDAGELLALVDGRAIRFRLLEENESLVKIKIGDELFSFKRQTSKFERPATVGKEVAEERNALQSPMPGRIVSILVREGQDVKSGQALLILESMKMETTLMSDRDNRVSEIAVKNGDAVLRGQVLLRYASDIAR